MLAINSLPWKIVTCTSSTYDIEVIFTTTPKITLTARKPTRDKKKTCLYHLMSFPPLNTFCIRNIGLHRIPRRITPRPHRKITICFQTIPNPALYVVSLLIKGIRPSRLCPGVYKLTATATVCKEGSSITGHKYCASAVITHAKRNRVPAKLLAQLYAWNCRIVSNP